jgi:hypothetical protein
VPQADLISFPSKLMAAIPRDLHSQMVSKCFLPRYCSCSP